VQLSRRTGVQPGGRQIRAAPGARIVSAATRRSPAAAFAGVRSDSRRADVNRAALTLDGAGEAAASWFARASPAAEARSAATATAARPRETGCSARGRAAGCRA
jgi:hypothetical protein